MILLFSTSTLSDSKWNELELQGLEHELARFLFLFLFLFFRPDVYYSSFSGPSQVFFKTKIYFFALKKQKANNIALYK